MPAGWWRRWRDRSARSRAVCVDGAASSAASASLTRSAIMPLHPVDRAGLGDQLGEPVEPAPSAAPSSANAASWAGVASSRASMQQHGRLAGAEVVAGRLAGRRRVAVDAEQVVAELERFADGQAIAGVRGDQRVVVRHAGQAAPKSSGRWTV